MNKKQSRRKYDEGFKTRALRLVTGGRSAAEVARSLGISENLLYKWRAEQKSAYSPEESPWDSEIESLRKALRQVEQDSLTSQIPFHQTKKGYAVRITL